MRLPTYRHINHQQHCSFVIKEGPFDLNTCWHYHEEIEIMYFQQGAVAGIMGDGFYHFKAGELVLLGSNFPHVIFKAKDENTSSVVPSGVVIQFKRDFLGSPFFEAPELNSISRLLAKSRGGIRFVPLLTDSCQHLLHGIGTRSSTRQLLDLLEILNLLAEEKGHELLSLKAAHSASEPDEARMQVIWQYLQRNFRENIAVKDVAEIVNMTVTSFCRYYKSRTLKHFKQTLNEMRVSYACELLLKNNNVQEACFESGFNNPAYFSRTFKKIVGVSPSAYRSSTALKVQRW
nr:helix-turn-helix domain-containing protein [Cytophagales bacterium]